MAKTLLLEMIRIARIRGLDKIVALVRSDNQPMIAVFKHNGFERKTSDSFQEVHLELLLSETT
jgi:ribosomal protein S18 acetylase RimI-like enzyme